MVMRRLIIKRDYKLRRRGQLGTFLRRDDASDGDNGHARRLSYDFRDS